MSTPRKARRSRRGFWAELPVLIVVALLIALVLKAFVIQAFYIPSSSMEPTLMVGDRVLVAKMAYLYRDPQRGEIVVFEENTPDDPGTDLFSDPVGGVAAGLGLTAGGQRDYIKRIIGLPGDTIQMSGGVITINGQPLPESPATDGGYLSQADLTDFGPVTVEAQHYFMMGDNRPNSADSRYAMGQIQRDQLLGRAFVTIWPVGSAGALPIADYVD